MEPYEVVAWAHRDYSNRHSLPEAAFKITIRTQIRCPYCGDELHVIRVEQGWAGHPFAFVAPCERCNLTLVRWRLEGFQQEVGDEPFR